MWRRIAPALLLASVLLGGCAGQAGGQPGQTGQATSLQEEFPVPLEEGAEEEAVVLPTPDQYPAHTLALPDGTVIRYDSGHGNSGGVTGYIRVEYPDGEVVTVYEGHGASPPWMSPAGDRFAYIADWDWEIMGNLYIYDLDGRTAQECVIEDLPSQYSPSGAAWLDEEYLLVQVMFAYGTVAVGGDIHVYHVEADIARPLILTRSMIAQVCSVAEAGENMVFTMAVYESEDYMYYREEEVLIPKEEVYRLIKSGGHWSVEGKTWIRISG